MEAKIFVTCTAMEANSRKRCSSYDNEIGLLFQNRYDLYDELVYVTLRAADLRLQLRTEEGFTCIGIKLPLIPIYF